MRVIGRAQATDGLRVPTISFVPEGITPEAVVRHVDTRGIGIRWGDFYARRLAQALPLPNGVVRVSMAHYNTADEIRRLIRAFEEVLP